MRMQRASKRRRKSKFLILFIVLIAIIGGYCAYQQIAEFKAGEKEDIKLSTSSSSNQSHEKEKGTSTESKEKSPVQKEITLEQKVNQLVKKMSLKEKIGQLVVVGFQSDAVDSHIQTMINDYKVGGIILYDRNMDTPQQVTKLTNDLQHLAKKSEHHIPLIVSIDQEGGQIVRMRDHVSPIPSQQELAKQGSAKNVFDTAYRNAKELKAMGINVNYAPVMDLSSTDSRSFGEDPKQAKAFGEQAIAGFQKAGITATLKHFPGNGRSNIDPHLETSSVQANQLDLENKDIYPFRKIIKEVNHQQFFMMVTHIKYPAYDKENPASISPIIIQKLLRQKLGYKGIVITDDLEMGAVSKYYSYPDLGYRAVDAGADLLLVCHTLESQKQVINGIIDAVQSGKLTEDRINQSVKRILTFKLSMIK